MIVKINPELKKVENIYDPINVEKIARLYQTVVSRLGNKGEIFELVKGLNDSNIRDIQLEYIRFLSNAYSFHEKIILAPHDIWYILLTEFAKIIEENIEKCRLLFTTSNKKIEVIVLSKDVIQIDPLLILNQLINLVPTDTKLFLPNFSTSTIQSRIASAATFAGSLKHYYNFGMQLCGIPEIKITGTLNDWNTISTNLKEIISLFHQNDVIVFKNKLLKDWYHDIEIIISNICKCLNGENMIEFMKDIYTQKNVGSGHQLSINGWISNFFCKENDKKFNLIENFSLNIGTLPYKNLDTGKEFIGVHGLFYKKIDEEEFVYPDFGEIIFEKKTK